MSIVQPNKYKNVELPLQLHISFEKVLTMYQKYASEAFQNHPFHQSSKIVIQEISKYPDLLHGFTDRNLLKTYEDQINLLLEPLFPEWLIENEIKAAIVPYLFTSFKFTNRLRNILEDAGENYQFNIRNFDKDSMYIMACTFILKNIYGFSVDLKRPFFFDIPNQKTGLIKHYRASYNASFSEIIKTDKAPKITKKDYKELLDNFKNIEFWKEKFPVDSYIFKGFGIINLIDVTKDHTISEIKATLLRSDENLVADLTDNLSKFYNIKKLKFGYSLIENTSKIIDTQHLALENSIIFKKGNQYTFDTFFCNKIIESVFQKQKAFSISNVEDYGVSSNKNPFYQSLKGSKIKSILLIPIKSKESKSVTLLEITSPKAYQLNSVNAQKLRDVLPVFEVAAKRADQEYENELEAIIQDNYTAIHPTVKWRFHQAAENFYRITEEKNKKAKVEEIIFKDVFPLYGQTDIRNSTAQRNEAIKKDLKTQLLLASNVLILVCNSHNLPIYKELNYRVNQYLEQLKEGLDAGGEIAIIDFLKREINAAFKHIQHLDEPLKKQVSIYFESLDRDLKIVYTKRRDYETSVNFLNEKLATHIDQKQVDAQKMYPHFFERYKTDGIEFNMYIGASLINEKHFDNLYLYNLRLWQLQTICELENIAHQAKRELKHQLSIASLILVYSNSLAIKFRLDEKKFDVDGAYNVRYEIIKKRIDKCLIKNSTERLTVPGKIAIVYTQDKEAIEYIKYINFLQSKKTLGKIEFLELEDLPGVSGLKALRVEVLFNSDFNYKKTITLNDLLKEIEN